MRQGVGLIRSLKAGEPSAFTGFHPRQWRFIEIRNNKIAISKCCRRCGAASPPWARPNASIHDLLIDSNEVYNGKFGWSNPAVLNSNVNLCDIERRVQTTTASALTLSALKAKTRIPRSIALAME
jgi:hypothetical protein